jgi:hypothetical protein
MAPKEKALRTGRPTMLDFQWKAPEIKAGFRWSGKQLCVAQPDIPLRRYRPLAQYPDLYRRVAKTPITKNGVLAFANRFGLLTSLEPDREPWQTWVNHLRWMQHLVEIWDLVVQDDRDALSQLVHWDGDQVQFLAQGASQELQPLTSPFPKAADPESAKWFQRAAVGLPQRIPAALQDLIRAGDLGGPVLWYLQEHLDQALRGRVRYRMTWDRDSRWPALQPMPADLITAIYLQLALAITEPRKHYRCQACGRVYELAPGLNKANRTTCSAACRQRLHRERYTRTLELHAQGRPENAIAEETGASLAAVKRWIKGSKGKKQPRGASDDGE